MKDLRATEQHSDQREYFSEKVALLATVLSPEETDQFRLRNSPRAEWLRGSVQYLGCTHEEFKSLLDWREQHLMDKPDHLAPSRADDIQAMRLLLGDERAREYERVSDMGYLNGRMAAERDGLWGLSADLAGQIVYEARVAAEQIAREASLPAEERLNRIQTLQAEAEGRLEMELGFENCVAVRNALRRTLVNMKGFIRP
jgi:hypothetical protein